jgi:hypothetical protein
MTMTYVSDVYLPVNADALTLVVGLKVSAAYIQGDWLCADNTALIERGMLRLPLRASSLDRRLWLHRKLWHASWRVRRYLPPGSPNHCLRTAYSSYHFPVANHPLGMVEAENIFQILSYLVHGVGFHLRLG